MRQDGVPVRKTGLRLAVDGGESAEASLEVHLVQLADLGTRWFLIFFEGPSQRALLQPAATRPVKHPILQFLQRRLDQGATPLPDNKDKKRRFPGSRQTSMQPAND